MSCGGLPYWGDAATHLEDIEADVSAQVDVRVVAWRVEFNGRRDIWIVWREGDGDFVGQTSVHLAREQVLDST